MGSAQNNPRRRSKQALPGGSSAPGVKERLLAAGVEIVSEVGLDTGLGRLNFEEAIKRAKVARATAYRQWSTKEAFGNAVLGGRRGEQRITTSDQHQLPGGTGRRRWCRRFRCRRTPTAKR